METDEGWLFWCLGHNALGVQWLSTFGTSDQPSTRPPPAAASTERASQRPAPQPAPTLPYLPACLPARLPACLPTGLPYPTLPYPTSTLPSHHPPARLLHPPSASRFVPFFACSTHCAVALHTLVDTKLVVARPHSAHPLLPPCPPSSPRRLVVIVARYLVCHRPPVVWCSPRIRARSAHILPILPIA